MSFGFVGKGIAAVRNKVVDLVSKNMEQAGAQAVSWARELVPYDTGATSESIAYYWSRSTMTLTLLAQTKYSVFLEFGTRKMAARPFLRPTISEVSKAFGLAKTEIQLPTAPQKYQAGYEKQIARGRGFKKVIVGIRKLTKR